MKYVPYNFCTEDEALPLFLTDSSQTSIQSSLFKYWKSGFDLSKLGMHNTDFHLFIFFSVH